MKSQGHGFGYWDATPFFSHNSNGRPMHALESVGEISGPYCGYRPCPWTMPALPPGLYSSVSGALGPLGSYPLINCETVYRSVDWNSGALAHLYLRSASCPGMSYGQDLTSALVGGTISWSSKGQTNVVYLDAKSLSWMRAGLGIGLPDPKSGTDWYVVTGVYPTLGYITVVYANTNSGSVGLAGAKAMVYSGGSPISQKAYSFTAYP
jgi:hypothetical protein